MTKHAVTALVAALSTLAGCALFLLVELLERARQVEVGPQQLDDGNDALPAFLDAEPPAGTNLDDNEEALIGRALPAALAFLGVAFTVVGFYFIETGHRPADRFFAVMMLVMLVGNIFLLYELDTPFSGVICLDPDKFTQAAQTIRALGGL